MALDALDVHDEIKNACNRVALDSPEQAKLLNLALSEFTKFEGEHKPTQIVKIALETTEAQMVLERNNVVDYTVTSDESGEDLSICFDRKFIDIDFDPDVILDAEMCVLGRTASEVAQQAIDGKKIALVNSAKIVIVGDKNSIVDRWQSSANSETNTTTPKTSKYIVKRSIRGMLPMNSSTGPEALRRIRVYDGVPEPFHGELKLPDDSRIAINPIKRQNYIHLDELAEYFD